MASKRRVGYLLLLHRCCERGWPEHPVHAGEENAVVRHRKLLTITFYPSKDIMNLSRLFLSTGIAVLLALSACKQPTQPQATNPKIAIYPNLADINFPDSVRNLIDGTTHLLTVEILVPCNVPQSFAIYNVGGGTLDYQVVSTTEGNVFTIQNATGSLPAGKGATISVSISPEFVNGGSLLPVSTALTIITPQASNFIKSLVGVAINNATSELLGTWNGTWSGINYDGGPGGPTQPVSGTWSLSIQETNTTDSTLAGTLIWRGNDGVWQNISVSNSTPILYPVDTTIALNSTNALFQANGACQYVILINNQTNGQQGDLTPDEFYGPFLMIYLPGNANSVSGIFHTHPYDGPYGGLSLGTITGIPGNITVTANARQHGFIPKTH